MTDSQKVKAIGAWLMVRGLILAIAITIIKVAAYLVDLSLPHIPKLI
jgi:flagellar biosynthesis protein FliQ